MLELSDVGLCLDTGHLLLGRGDPVTAVRDWAQRINHFHLKDARRAILEEIVAESAPVQEIWRRHAFCALGDGDIPIDDVLRRCARSATRAGWWPSRTSSRPRAPGAAGARPAAQPRVPPGAWVLETDGIDSAGADRAGRRRTHGSRSPAGDARLGRDRAGRGRRAGRRGPGGAPCRWRRDLRRGRSATRTGRPRRRPDRGADRPAHGTGRHLHQRRRTGPVREACGRPRGGRRRDRTGRTRSRCAAPGRLLATLRAGAPRASRTDRGGRTRRHLPTLVHAMGPRTAVGGLSRSQRRHRDRHVRPRVRPDPLASGSGDRVADRNHRRTGQRTSGDRSGCRPDPGRPFGRHRRNGLGRQTLPDRGFVLG